MENKYGSIKRSKIGSVVTEYGEILLLYRLWERADGACTLSVELRKGGEICDVAVLSDISVNAVEAERMFESFSNGLVTPVTAEEIFSDLCSL